MRYGSRRSRTRSRDEARPRDGHRCGVDGGACARTHALASAQPELGLKELVQAMAKTFAGLGVLPPLGAQPRSVDDAKVREQRTLEHGIEQRPCRSAHRLAHVLGGDSRAFRSRREERIWKNAPHGMAKQAFSLARDHALAARA